MDGANLTISLLKLSDSGSYTCSVIAVSNPQESGTTVLRVTDAPIAHISLLGNQLTCNVEGNPKPTLTWFLPDGSIAYKAPSVYVAPTAANNGRYVCMATNPPESKELQISSVPSHGVIREGEDLQLHCSTNSHPISTYDWYFNGEKVGTGSFYTLKNIQRHEAGSYRCKAYNYVPGIAAGDIAITVEFPPSSVYVEENKDVLSCFSKSGGVPWPIYKWKLPNGTETAGNMSLLRNPASTGKYVCSVRNIHGISNVTYVKVTGPT
uniref:Ig-like domain-containing protein n=1 Tax=Ciona savignyi TaxID=51511 RepID=H2YB61_CIOSA